MPRPSAVSMTSHINTCNILFECKLNLWKFILWWALRLWRLPNVTFFCAINMMSKGHLKTRWYENSSINWGPIGLNATPGGARWDVPPSLTRLILPGISEHWCQSWLVHTEQRRPGSLRHKASRLWVKRRPWAGQRAVSWSWSAHLLASFWAAVRGLWGKTRKYIKVG